MNGSEFRDIFQALTGHPPLSWQQRLFQGFVKDDIPSVIDLPTGLGKTMVMAIWLIALTVNRELPRRLIYVVDRRTVVDQATDLATKLRQNFVGEHPLAISTLRGQLADNREWSRDPSRLAIIIGTVDLIGSGLLFSGYRSSYKRRPLEAGLLGQDSLLVLDEAHLSKPFEKLIRAIDRDGSFQKTRDGQKQGNPLQVIRMSATSGDSNDSQPPFTLLLDADGNLTGEDAKDGTITERFGAKKRLTIKPDVDPKKLNDTMAEAAIDMARSESLKGKRIVVFVRRPDDAKAIAQAIRDHVTKLEDESGPKPKKVKNTPYADSVAVLTGTMRGWERDKLVEEPVLERFLNGDEVPGENDNPVFLVSTSAGEVGMDLNADHMVCDATTIDSLIQRLGRVNRRGHGEAAVVLVREKPKEKVGTPIDLKGVHRAIANTAELLTDGMSLTPQNVAALKAGIWKDKYADACSPEPTTVELTDILLDAWSMTSIRERMPGRPEVGPWLRGIDDQQAQTTIAWRTELDLFQGNPSPEKALQAIFAKHPIRPHESLTVNTGHLLEFLKKIPKLKDRPNDLMTTRNAVRLPRGQVVCRTLQQLTDDPGILYADSTLILPATFGGLNAGMLDAESVSKKRNDDESEPRSLDIADHEGYEQTDAARSRLRILIERSEDGSWTPKPLPGLSIPADIKLDPTYDKSNGLFNDLKGADLRVRLVQPIEWDVENAPVRSLVVLAPAPKEKGKEDQPLTKHVDAVKAEAERIADELHLAKDDPVHTALLFAAKWHDEGKKARVWQVFANNPDPEGDQPRGKMAQSRDPKSLRGYRHEFGSILRIEHPGRCNITGCDSPTNPDALELALHLIATHHGAGRPHFEHALYDPFTDQERDDLHTEAIRRFARLQRKYGRWLLAWLENLLRCADALASADEEVTEIDELEGGEE